VSDFEKRSNVCVLAQASSCQRTASVCEGGNCSLGAAVETATSCAHPGTTSCVFSVVDCRTRWTSGSENEAVASPSRAIVVA
jgi:hypothetical protein